LNFAGYPNEGERMKAGVRSSFQNCVANQKKIFVILHHTPGELDVTMSEAVWLEELLVEYSEPIVLTIAGHTHYDEFRLIVDKSLVSKEVVFTTSSIDPHYVINPAVRLFFLDRDTRELIDYEHYYMDLKAVIQNPNQEPQIVRLYSAMDEYKLPDMSAKSHENLLYKFQTDQPLLLKHLNHKRGNAGPAITSCNATCAKEYICTQMHARYDHREACIGDQACPRLPAFFTFS